MARKNREEKENQEKDKAEDYHCWLRPTTPLSTPVVVKPAPQFSLFSDDDYTKWLHPDSLKLTTKCNKKKNLKVTSIFPDGDLSKWLHPDTLASMSRLNVKKIPEFPSISSDPDYRKWLHPESLARGLEDTDTKSLSVSSNSSTRFSFIDTVVPTSDSKTESNSWLTDETNSKTLIRPSSISEFKDTLNEMKQATGKFAQVHTNWTHQWLNHANQ